MEIQLGFINQYENGYSTHLDKELSPQELTLFINANSELHNYENLKMLYEILILNQNEFYNYIETEKKSLFENSLSAIGDKKTYYGHHLNLNRLILNYLSSLKTLLDHSETTIKRKYGKSSIEVNKFKAKTSDIFDNFFSYRFFYKLRNYSQHCGIPIDEFEISATKIDEIKFKTSYEINFSAKELLEKYKEWGTVKNDLITLDKFSIFPLLEEMKDVLSELWLFIISIFEKDIIDAIEFINLNAGYLKDKGSVCIFSNLVRDEYGNAKYFTSTSIPFDIIEELTR